MINLTSLQSRKGFRVLGNCNEMQGYSISFTHSLTHSSRSLNDRWGIKEDRATTFLHSSLSSAFRRVSPNPNRVHSDIFSFHLFFCLPFLLPPCIVPCRIIFASPTQHNRRQITGLVICVSVCRYSFELAWDQQIKGSCGSVLHVFH